jgi:hypothetical protein
MRNKTILALCLFFLYLSVYAPRIATASDNATLELCQTEVLNDKNMNEHELEPSARAARFANSREKFWKNPDGKQQDFSSMMRLQQEADGYKKRKIYHKAARLYYEAAIYYPRTLLFFKSSEMMLQSILAHEDIYLESLRSVLYEDYQLALEFYQYEQENDKSVSQGCLGKMHLKVECLQGIYLIYNNTGNDVVIPKEDILQCMRMEPDIFHYENYCK